MLKIALTLLMVMISVYWIGEKIRRNTKIDQFLTAIEGRYSKLNNRLEEANVINGLRLLCRIYGWASVFLLVSLFVFQRFSKQSPANLLPLFWLFSFAFMGWFSIKWVIDHKNTVVEFSRNFALVIFCPLLLGAFDLFFHTGFIEIALIPFHQTAAALHQNLPDISNPLAIGGAISLVFLIIFAVYYLVTWAITAPLFMISVFAVVLPIRFARFLAQMDRDNTFLWFTVFVMIVISAWLTRL